jgi:hypothetical protein
MDIIEPVTLGDVAFTRPSPKWVFDKTGTLVQVPAGTFAVTYDSSDLSKAPYPVVEPAATNLITSSGRNESWGNAPASVRYVVAPDGSVNGVVPLTSNGANRWQFQLNAGQLPNGTVLTLSVFVATVTPTAGSGQALSPTNHVGLTSDAFFSQIEPSGALGYARYACKVVVVDNSAAQLLRVYIPFVGVDDLAAWGWQWEVGDKASSYISTGGSPVTRDADAVSPGAGLAHSNVPITEPDYNSATTYAKDAVVHDPATHNVYQSLIDGNVGRGLTDTTAPVAWALRGMTNRWAMLDQYNNTQTTNAEEIILVVSPQTISQGFYVGNVDASEVRVAVTDLYKGLVYQETQSLRVSNSESSFFNWCFRRKRNRTWAVSLKLRPYANALVTITIKKPGGTAKCGMCVVGPTMDLGRTLMTLGAEIKDFSDTSFNFDGTSKTTIRNWAKRISADVVVDASRVDDVYEFMASYRQRPLVWIGSPNYGLAIAYGRYSGIKPVVKGKNRWDMSMQIEGTV